MIDIVPVDVAEEWLAHDLLRISGAASQSLVRFTDEQFLQDRHRVPRHVNRVERLVRQNSVINFVLVFTSEWRLLQEHLVDKNTKGPPIDSAAVFLIQKNLLKVSIVLHCIHMAVHTSGAMNSGVPQNVLVVEPNHMSSLQRP